MILTKNSFRRKPSREPWNVGKKLWSPSKYVASCCTVIIRGSANGTQLTHSYTPVGYSWSAGTIIAICLVVVNIDQSSADLSGLTRAEADSALRTHLRPRYVERRTGREWKGRKVRVYSLACGKLTRSAVTKAGGRAINGVAESTYQHDWWRPGILFRFILNERHY